MSLKNKTAKPAKEIKNALKDSYDVKLSSNAVNALGVLINFGLQNGAVKVKNEQGQEICTLAELTVDLKREIQSQLK